MTESDAARALVVPTGAIGPSAMTQVFCHSEQPSVRDLVGHGIVHPKSDDSTHR
ncbi:MAG: hypothetical protein R3A47_07235 [Polyangiales bacterium]